MNARITIAAAALVLVAGCAQAPTAPVLDAPAMPRFDAGSAGRTDDFETTTTGFDGTESTETAPADSTGRGGFTVGSGN